RTPGQVPIPTGSFPAAGTAMSEQAALPSVNGAPWPPVEARAGAGAGAADAGSAPDPAVAASGMATAASIARPISTLRRIVAPSCRSRCSTSTQQTAKDGASFAPIVPVWPDRQPMGTAAQDRLSAPTPAPR